MDPPCGHENPNLPTIVHTKWTERSHIPSRRPQGDVTIFHYDIPVLPSRPLEIGLRVRLLALSNVRFHAPTSYGGRTIRRYDTYDQGIQGPIVKVVDHAIRWVTFAVYNEVPESPITYAYITAPYLQDLTVRITSGVLPRKTLLNGVGKGREPPLLEYGAQVGPPPPPAGPRRWQWVELATDEEEEWEERCADREMAEGDGEAMDSLLQSAAHTRDRRPPPRNLQMKSVNATTGTKRKRTHTPARPQKTATSTHAATLKAAGPYTVEVYATRIRAGQETRPSTSSARGRFRLKAGLTS
ncbi:hypothetical protein C8Q76DRAFT_794648 [Earliella scabrosa]|nr:hypothetical protein C8Q76DRAFT_794648 [Earliella scabrosa]